MSLSDAVTFDRAKRRVHVGSAERPLSLAVTGIFNRGHLSTDGVSDLRGAVTLRGALAFPVGHADGRLLTSDAAGNASWRAPAANKEFPVAAHFNMTDVVSVDTSISLGNAWLVDRHVSGEVGDASSLQNGDVLATGASFSGYSGTILLTLLRADGTTALVRVQCHAGSVMTLGGFAGSVVAARYSGIMLAV